ncbi:MAG: trigger factor [Dehalococcoidales bacterium]|nr:trigger factor [Dehalococcoidales bacterium]
MKVTNEKTENRQAFLTVEMEPAEVEESMEGAYRQIVKKTKIPGFRQGKAPRAILERYIGKERLFNEALNNLLPSAYEKAINEQEIEAFAQPQIEVAQTDPLVFKVMVPLKPVVKLGDYRQIEIAPEPVKEVTGEDIDEVIERLRHQHATWEPVDRPVEFNDLVVLDIESHVEDKPFINQKGAQYQVIRDQSFPLPGFSEQLANMKNNEEKKFKLQVPPDYPGNELAGKEAVFKVKLSEIKQEILPELNNNFAQEVSADFKSLASLRKRIESELKNKAEENARLNYEDRVVDAVVNLSEMDFPPILVETEISRFLNQRFQNSSQGLDEYLSNVNKTEEEIREELRPPATEKVSRSLVLSKVAEEEKIEISPAQIDTEIKNITEGANSNKVELEKALNTPQFRTSIEQTLFTRKTIQRLTEMANKGKINKSTKIRKETKKKGAK